MADQSKKRIRQLSYEAEQILLNRNPSPFMKRMQATFLTTDDARKGITEENTESEEIPTRKSGLVYILQQFFSL